MHGLDDDFRRGHRRWIERGLTPSNINRQTRKVDDASVATVATQVVRGPHENAIHRTGLNTQSAKHALGIVNREAGNLEAFAVGDTLFTNVNAVDRTGLGALVARNASGQIVAMETAVARRNRNRQFGILKMLGKGAPLGSVRNDPVTQRHPQSVRHGKHRVPHVP